MPVVRLSGAVTLVGEIVVVHETPCWVTETICPAIVSVPLRDALPVFAAIDNVTVPLPEPVALLVTAIHESVLTAVHAHPATDVTEMLPVDAATPRKARGRQGIGEGGRQLRHGERSGPALIVAERSAVVGSAATLYATVPLPLPLGALVIVNHGALLDAVHPQPLFAHREAARRNGRSDGHARGREHIGALAAACDTETICAPIAIVPLRPKPSRFRRWRNRPCRFQCRRRCR